MTKESVMSEKGSTLHYATSEYWRTCVFTRNIYDCYYDIQ